ncbi:hypothetical protein EV360DRAFT_78294 [Lentinula raphanica]|nr:hypothetical protein EV360DRAFT_78294 [Lentinula raphanica]
MGWDLTVEFSHYSQSGRRQYTIEVDGQKFTTVDVLSDASAARPLGRATRVWKVLDSSGIIRILKDVWLESDRMGEHEIHHAILDDVEKFDQAHHSNYRAKLEQRMLRPLAQCRVPVNHKPDDTAAVMLRGYDSSNDSSVDRFTSNNPSNPAAQSVGFSMSFDRDPDDLTTEPKPDNSQITQEPAAINQDSDQIMSTELAKRKARNYIHHHRIVFKHYATTIYNERSLGDTQTPSHPLLQLKKIIIPSAYLNEAKGHLSPSFAPAIETIKALALLLTAAYQKSEKQYNMTGNIDDKCFEIHRRFCKLLTSKLLNSLCGITLVPVKDDGKKRTNLGPPETESPAKRSRTSVP